MKKWMQSLVAAALLVSMVAVEAVTPMTAYATETEDEEEIEAEVEDEKPEIEEEPEVEEKAAEPEADETSEESEKPAEVKESIPVYLDESAQLETPALGKATAEAAGTKITWSKVADAKSYKILRSTSNGSSAKWSEIGTATGTSYTDTASLSSGTTYYYTVQACADKEVSEYDTTGLKSVYLATPKLSDTKGAASGIKVSWEKVSGAKAYAVFRKLSGSGNSWDLIGTTTSTSYTDKEKLKAGETYKYTVRALATDGKTAQNDQYNAAYWGGYNTTGIKAIYLAIPALNDTETVTNGIKVSWGKVSKATGYAVYRRKSGGSWSLLTTTTSTSYKDKSGLSSGQKYEYTVRAYRGTLSTAKKNKYNATYWSGYDSAGVSAKFLTTPTVKVTKPSKGTKVSWNSVKGASGYVVYRKKSGSKWSMIKTTTSTSYVDKEELSAGVSYYYTVRAFSGTETKAKQNKYSPVYWSHYKKSSSSVYLAAPKLNKVKMTSKKYAKLTWNTVSGASGYAVLRKKTSSGKWSLIATTTSTSYTDTTFLTANTTYYYTVRPYKGSASAAKNHKYKAKYWGKYDTTGLKYVAPETAAAMNAKAQSYSSDTKYLIMVDTKNNRLGIYTGSKGKWTRKYLWICTTGKASTPTPTGQYKTQDKGRYYNGETYTCWYYTRWHNGYLFHSVLYNLGSSTSIRDGALGVNKSHGCIRLTREHAKWIYDYIPRGTKVVTYR